MEQDTLVEILGVEKEIRDRLDAERKQASQWLERERHEIDEAHLAAMAALEASVAKGAATAGQVASDKAAGILREAKVAACEPDRLPDEFLRDLVRRHIAVIVPGDTP